MAKRRKKKFKLGKLGKVRDPKSIAGAAFPPLAGASVAAGVAVAIRKLTNIDARWAPLIGFGAGTAFAAATNEYAGRTQAISAFAASLAATVGLVLYEGSVYGGPTIFSGLSGAGLGRLTSNRVVVSERMLR